MRGEQNLRAGQGGEAGVFHEVVVVANQHADSAAVGRVENRVLIARREEFADEHVQLAVAGPAAVGHGDDKAVVELVVGVALDEPRTDGHAVLF